MTPASSHSRARPRSGRRLAEWALPAHARRLSVPTYDRSRLAPGVVHIGVGGFHRAHQLVYFDDLAERGISREWGVVGVNLRSRDVRDALAAQDHLFTVVERSARGERARIVGALQRCLVAPEDPEAVLDALGDARTRLVTLTITGDGYPVDRVSGEFQAGSPEVAAELARRRPTTAHGFLVEALARRRAAGRAAFTVLSCDNLPDNGAAARAAVVGFARLRDPELAAWIDEHGAFPSSMVDRITPRTREADRAFVGARFGVEDRCPVMTEPFSQWVVEDRFCDGRPPLEEVGAEVVADVAPHKLLKSRMLNGAHTALGPLAHLAGHVAIDAAMTDPVFAAFTEELLAREIEPLLPEVDGVDTAEYRRTLLRRFANPRTADRLARLCERGSTKLPSYLVPSAADALERGGRHSLLALSVAGWLRFYRGVDAHGRPFPIEDPLAGELRRAARAPDGPAAMLRRTGVFSGLGEHERFVSAVRLAVADIDRYGPRAAVAAHVHADRMAAAA